MARKVRSRTRRTGRSTNRRSVMVLTPINYYLLAACALTIIVGFTLMRIDNQVDGFVSLYISPIILMIGYVGVIPSVLYRPKREEPEI